MRSRVARDPEQSTFPHRTGIDPAPQGAIGRSRGKIIPLAGNFPDDHLPAIMTNGSPPWNPAILAERIEAQAAVLGVAKTALLKAAGIPEKAVRDLAEGHWPNLRRVAQLATAFKFPGGIAELLGVSNEADGRCDPKILHVALELVGSVIDGKGQECPLRSRPHVVAGLAAVAHRQLIELQRIDPSALDNAAVLHMISVVLRSELARFERPNS